MSHFPPASTTRKLLAVALGAGLMAGATPGAALAGGGKPASKPTSTTCDPAVQFCGTGRKNG